MEKDIHIFLNHCNSLRMSQTTSQNINKKTKSNPLSVSNLSKQLNINWNGHLLEKHFNASGRFFM